MRPDFARKQLQRAARLGRIHSGQRRRHDEMRAGVLAGESLEFRDDLRRRPDHHVLGIRRRAQVLGAFQFPDRLVAGHVVGLAFAPGFTALDVGVYDLGMNWFWDGRHYSFITVPGADGGAWVGGINNRDQVSGYYADSSGYWHGFVKDGPHFTTFDVPGADYTLVSGINNDGVVTGGYAGADGVPHGYIWFAGQAVTVDVSIGGAIVTEWLGLNDHGDLAGEYFDTDFVNHAVIAERVDGDGD